MVLGVIVEVCLGVCLDDCFFVGSMKVSVHVSVAVFDLMFIYLNSVGVRVVVVFDLELVIELFVMVMVL